MQGKLYQYHLTRELAKKYSHVTYLASPTDEPEHQVILTIFTSSLFRFPHEREKLLSKAQRIKKLHHPHLVPILDMGIEQDQPFVVQQYLPNGSLRSRLKKLSPHHLELGEALSIVSQVGSALAYAHEHNIVHGNLQPENILLDGSGQAVLTDFNLINKNDAIIRDQTTKEYAFCYLAPEQFAGTCNAKSDQYALGCLAYELMTGHVPFAAQGLASMMGHHNNAGPVPLSESIVGLSPSLEVAVLKALAKDPDERFDDFLLFLEVIQSSLSPSPAFPLTHSPHSRSTRTISHSTQSAKAGIVLFPIRKRAAKRSTPQQPEPSQAFFNSMADMAEPAITPPPSTIGMPEWAGIIPPSESLASILQPHQFTSPPSENTDLPSNGENDSPDQPLKEQSHKESSVTMPSVFSSHEIGTRASVHESTIASNASMVSTDSPDPVASQFHDDAVFSSEPHSNANQTCFRENADEVWLTNLFGEQERHDLSATRSVSLEQEQHESGRDKRDEMTLSLPKDSDGDMPLRRRTQHNRGKVLAMVFLCFVIAASGIYAAFFPLRTGKPDQLVHSTQVVKQAGILTRRGVSPTQLTASVIPTQLAVSTTPMPTVQPTPPIGASPTVILTPTPIPTPVMLRITAIDDSVQGTGLNQFNYVGSGWQHCQPCQDPNGFLYDNSNSWDNTSHNYVTLTFTGVQIKLYGVLDPSHGIGAVSVDGGNETMIDYYAASRAGDQLMWTSPMLPAGTHTFKLRVTGTKNPSSSDTAVTVDRVDILS
ncbi:MAG TPA: protein kinase [Ktedonobacteraceae bacterium]|nr:protein kinase [Ktedonobacteraceae bacterium]